MNIIQPMFFAEASDAGIRAAALAARDAGGGTVIIPAGTIEITAPLPRYPGVVYQGTGWQPHFTSIYVPLKGTVLQGNGTFPCFEWNPWNEGQTVSPIPATSSSDLINKLCNGYVGTPPEPSSPGSLRGGGVTDLNIVNFSHGIKDGEKYRVGAAWAKYERLNFWFCNQWSIFIENPVQCHVRNINIDMAGQIFQPSNPEAQVLAPPDDEEIGTGAVWIGASGGTPGPYQMNFGNSQYADIYANVHHPSLRGFVFAQRGGYLAINNLCSIDGIQVLRTNSSLPNVLMVQSSTPPPPPHPEPDVRDKIYLGTGTGGFGWAVVRKHMPLMFADSGLLMPAIDNNLIYFVVDKGSDDNGNWIKVGKHVNAPAITLIPPLNAFDTRWRGFSGVELYGDNNADDYGPPIGTVVPSSIQNTTISSLLVEGPCSAGVLMQSCLNVSVQTNLVWPPSYGAMDRTYCLRRAIRCQINHPELFDLDADFFSGSTMLHGAMTAAGISGDTGILGLRVFSETNPSIAVPSMGLFMTGSFKEPDIYIDPYTYGPAFRSNPVVRGARFTTSIHIDQYRRQPNSYVWDGDASNSAAIVESLDAAQDGLRLLISNPTASALTLTCPAGNEWNRDASRDTVVAAKSCVLIEACRDATGMFWARL